MQTYHPILKPPPPNRQKTPKRFTRQLSCHWPKCADDVDPLDAKQKINRVAKVLTTLFRKAIINFETNFLFMSTDALMVQINLGLIHTVNNTHT